jgi:hypothetical protein
MTLVEKKSRGAQFIAYALIGIMLAAMGYGVGVWSAPVTSFGIDGSGNLKVNSLDVNDYKYQGTSIETDALLYPEETASYVVWVDGATYYAKNGHTGAVTSNADAYTLFQGIITAADDNGLNMVVKTGNYVFTTKLLITHPNVYITADPEVFFSGAILPILEVDGNAFDGARATTVNNIQLKNIHFLYTGAVATGKVLYVHQVQNDRTYAGAIILENLSIENTLSPTIPTDLTFIGFNLEDAIGVQVNYLSASYFGVGVKYTGTGEQGSHNVWTQLFVSYCKYGYWDTADETAITLISPKIMECLTYGIYLQMLNEYVITSPQIEGSLTCTGIYSTDNYIVSIRGGVFSSLTTGIKFGPYWEVSNPKSAEVVGNWFFTCTTGVDTARKTYLFGNKYETVTYPVNIDTPAAESAGYIWGGDEGYSVTKIGEYLGVVNVTQTVCTITTVPGGLYEVGGYLNVVSRSAGVLYYCVSYVDENSNARNDVGIALLKDGSIYVLFADVVQNYSLITTTIRAKAGTVIKLEASDSGFSGTYDVGGFIRQIK